MAFGGQNFTTGNTLRQLISFSGPIIGANLLQLSFQFIDSLWIGNLLGAQALGAVAVSTVIVFTVLSFVIGMNGAALTILSQQRGRGDEQGLRDYLNAFVVMMFLVALVLGVIGFIFSPQLLELMGTPAELMADANSYLRVNFLGMMFLFGYNFIATVLRAMGDSKTPMRFVFLAVVLNLVLDPLFIATFNMGVAGAAYATIVAQGAAFGYGLYTVVRKNLAPLQKPALPSGEQVKTILQLGIPAGLQMAVISGGSAAVMSVVTSFGGFVMGGFSAAQRLDSIIIVPAQALGIAVSSMAGQNIGRRNWVRVGQIARVGLQYVLAITLVIATLVVVFARPLIGMFIDEPASVEFAVSYLRIVAFCYPFLGINFVLNAIARAAGAMYPVLVLNIISFWVLRFPLSSLFAGFVGAHGIGIGIGVSYVISSALAVWYYRYGRWREKQLFGAPVG